MATFLDLCCWQNKDCLIVNPTENDLLNQTRSKIVILLRKRLWNKWNSVLIVHWRTKYGNFTTFIMLDDFEMISAGWREQFYKTVFMYSLTYSTVTTQTVAKYERALQKFDIFWTITLIITKSSPFDGHNFLITNISTADIKTILFLSLVALVSILVEIQTLSSPYQTPRKTLHLTGSAARKEMKGIFHLIHEGYSFIITNVTIMS